MRFANYSEGHSEGCSVAACPSGLTVLCNGDLMGADGGQSFSVPKNTGWRQRHRRQPCHPSRKRDQLEGGTRCQAHACPAGSLPPGKSPPDHSRMLPHVLQHHLLDGRCITFFLKQGLGQTGAGQSLPYCTPMVTVQHRHALFDCFVFVSQASRRNGSCLLLCSQNTGEWT